MLCQNCKQNIASHAKEYIVDGELLEKNLCDDCFFALEAEDEEIEEELDENVFKETQKPEIFCPFCNTSSHTFLNTSYVGCGECYEAFFDVIKPVIFSLHGSGRHLGKFVGVSALDSVQNQKLMELTRKLSECVEKEDYEKAAQIKLQISRLKEELI